MALRDGSLRYQLRNPAQSGWRFEAFDLAQDPGLEHDLFDASDPTHAERARQLEAYKARLVSSYREKSERERFLPADEEERALRRLGYIR